MSLEGWDAAAALGERMADQAREAQRAAERAAAAFRRLEAALEEPWDDYDRWEREQHGDS